LSELKLERVISFLTRSDLMITSGSDFEAVILEAA